MGIAWVAADEAIGIGDGPADPRAAVSPGGRPTLVVPIRASDQVIAVAQGSKAFSHIIIGPGADEAIGVGEGAADPRAAVGPGRRPAIAVPVRTSDHVVAVAQGGDTGAIGIPHVRT